MACFIRVHRIAGDGKKEPVTLNAVHVIKVERRADDGCYIYLFYGPNTERLVTAETQEQVETMLLSAAGQASFP